MKCSCSRCGGQIEYDAASSGLEISCPHCQQLTRLAAYCAGPPPLAAPTPVPPRKKSSAWIVLLIIIGALVIAIPVMGLLAAIAIPNFVKARQASQRAACVSNLKSIEAAKTTWTLENRKTDSEVPTDVELFGPDRYLKERPICPAGGDYTIHFVTKKAECSVPGHEL